MDNIKDTNGERIVKTFEQMKGERTNWDNYWDMIAKFVIPKRDNVYGQRAQGQVMEDYLFDNTSVHANELLASALHGMLTNPSAVWFGLFLGVEEVDSVDAVRKWFQDTVHRVIYVLNNSNFQTEVHEYYLDIGSIGTSVFRVEEDEANIVRFHCRPIYEHFVAENNLGIIDTTYRSYEFTYKQMFEEFGEKPFAIDNHLAEKLRDRPMEKEKIIHAVEPRKLIDVTKAPVNINMPFSSAHVLHRTKMTLKESGFLENPYIIGRWTKLSGEQYGRSPAMKALADIKMLNAMMKVTLQAAQLAVAPPLQVPDDGVLLPLKWTPHAVNFFRAGTKDRIEPLQTAVRPELGLDIIENVRERIRQAFFIDQLQLNEGPQMTATEVMQRTEEKLRLLGPILGRQNYEFLEPVIGRVLKIMIRRGLLLPMPSELVTALSKNAGKIQIRYTSQIAKAQRTTEADNFTRLLNVVAPIFQITPDMVDNIDTDVLIRKLGDVFDVHHTIIRDKRDVEGMRNERAKQQQAQQALEQGNMASQMYKNVQSKQGVM